MNISNTPPADFARALYLGSVSWAMARGTTPGILEIRLREAAEQASMALKPSLGEADVLAALAEARNLLADPREADPDILELRSKVTLALDEIAGRQQVYQSMTVLVVGSGLILALAVLGKLKVKNGKWELVEGLPGFEKLAKLFPSIFVSS